jgi:putative DNA primase/helicase
MVSPIPDLASVGIACSPRTSFMLGQSDQERARSALFFLDPDCDREEWVRIAMAAKAAGLQFSDFHDWSAKGKKYKGERDCLSVWKSLNQNGDITERTLFWLSRQKGWQGSSSFSLRRAQVAEQRPSTAQKGRKPVITPNPLRDSDRRALEIWNRGEPASSMQPYILKKKGMADGLRVYPKSAPPLIINDENVAGWLMVPCADIEGTLQTIQFISPGKDKLNLSHASFGEGFHVLGDIKEAARIVVVEGIGQAWAVHQATGATTVVCFGDARLAKVAHALHQQYPKATLMLLPDRGKEAKAAKIARAINGEWCELPANKKGNYDVNDLMLEEGFEAVEKVLAAPIKPAMRFQLTPASGLQRLPPMKWLVQNVLPVSGLVAMYGPSGSGKSFLALDLAAAIAAGKPTWFGFPVKPCVVTYIALEGKQGMAMRMRAWSERHGAAPDSLAFVTDAFDLLRGGDVEELAKAIRSSNRHNGLVIIDTLNRAAPNAEENSSADMGRIIAAASRLQELLGGVVMLIHHSGKDGGKGLRGHSSLHAALDAIIEVGKHTSQRWWKVAKCKDSEDGGQYPFMLEPVQLGTDEDGQAVNSCIVIAAGTIPATEAKASTKKPRLGKHQVVAKSILDEMLRRTGEIDNAGVPERSSCIRYDDAVAAVATSLDCELGRKNERARQAIGDLINKGLYRSTGEWLCRS